MSRPSGLPLIQDDAAVVTVSVAQIEARGRLNILPRWRKRISWLSAETDADVEALMTFSEPGLITVSEWKAAGPRILNRVEELSTSSDPDALEALRLIQDRYQRIIIPARDRPSLGDGALTHLGLSIDRSQKYVVYVCVYSDRIELMSREYRNLKQLAGHPLIDGLP